LPQRRPEPNSTGDIAPALEVRKIHSVPTETTSGLSAVFEVNRPSLHRFLIARRAQPAEADDILQELFLKIGRLPTGPIADPLAYLYRMADNLYLDMLRSQSRRSVREEAWMAARHGTGDSDGQPTAEDQLIARERLVLVQRALRRLPERTVLIFRRYRLDGIAQRHIAAELGITVSAVEKHLQRAYRALIEARAEIDADSWPARRPSGAGG
jgi:RNA polymerase sigma factor (sigma-70 family)